MDKYIADYNVAFNVYFDIYITANPEAVAASFTPAAGDTKRSYDGGATFGNTTNVCTFANGVIKVALTAAELSNPRIVVKFEDQDAALVNDTAVEILTKNHASAFYGSVDITTDSNGYVTTGSSPGALTAPSAGAPSATPSADQALAYLYTCLLRNKVTVNEDAGKIQYYADDGSTILFEVPYTDSASVLTVSEAQADV